MKKIYLTLIVIVVVVAAGYLLLKKAPTPVEINVADAAWSTATTSTATVVAHIITYTDAGFVPNSVTIKKGETVTYKNDSKLAMWPASAKHPTHGNYPTTGGCLGSTFDACKGVQPGESWSFQFDFVGTWPFHDHLTPKFFGKVIVEE